MPLINLLHAYSNHDKAFSREEESDISVFNRLSNLSGFTRTFIL